MRNPLIITLLLLLNLCVYAQKEVFRIDSLPKEGVLLNKGWKFHAGDNPDFAKPNFNDSKWESIDPTMDVLAIREFQEQQIGWFRICLKVDKSLFGKTKGLAIKQTGNSEFFFNGELLRKFGHFVDSSNINTNFGFDPSENAISLTFDSTEYQIMAVRFQKPSPTIRKHIFYDNIALRLKILPIEAIVENYNSSNHITLLDHYLDVFKAGLMFFLALFYLFLYRFDSSRKGYILVSIWTLLGALSLVLGTLTFYLTDIGLRNILSTSTLFLITTSYTTQYIATLYFFGRTLKIMTYFVIIGYLFSVVFLFINYPWGWSLGAFGLNSLTSIGIVVVSWQAYKSGEKAAKFICYGNIIFMVFFIFSILIVSKKLSFEIPYWLIEIIVNFGILIPVIAYVYFFASKFDINRKDLIRKISEIERLSSEKQDALKKQNIELQAALLQGQTIERKRVAADLHDNLGSTLSALWLSVDMIDKSKMNEEETAIHQNLRQNLEKAYNDVRLLSHNLLPEELEKQGLSAALHYFIRKINQNSSIKFYLQIDERLGKLDKKIEFELYSICLELVNNIIKHSKATKAKIEISKTENQIKLTVEDNGIGIFENNSNGKGMKNVRARVESLNGTWNLVSTENKGVRSEVLIPI